MAPQLNHPKPNMSDPAARNLRPITEAQAAAEPAAERLKFEMPQADLPADLGAPKDAPATNGQQAPAPAKAPRKIVVSTMVEHRGRTFTIAAEGYTLDQLCDMLEQKKYTAPATTPAIAPLATPDDLPEGWKLCRKHGAPMRPRNKQNEHWHSHNVGTKDEPIWCKGYKGADSPGYDQ